MLARPVTTMPRAAPATRPKTSPGTIRECDRAPKAHILAPSTAHTPQTHSAHGHNRPRGCTAPHPRPHIHPKPTAHMATIPVEGAHPRTLDRTYTPNPQHTRPQFLSRVHTLAPSTAHTPQTHSTHGHNSCRGCTPPHPQRHIHPKSTAHTTTTAPEGAYPCTLGGSYERPASAGLRRHVSGPAQSTQPSRPRFRAQSTQVSRPVEPGLAPSRAGSCASAAGLNRGFPR